MNKIFLLFIVVAFVSSSIISRRRSTTKKEANKTDKNIETSFYKLSAKDIDGNDISMSKFKGKHVLVVNVASKCGFAYQYDDLQKLHDQYNGKLVVLGFPSRDFLGQEYKTAKKIKSFCSLKKITFPLFETVSIKGKNKHNIYEWLTNKSLNGTNSTKPSWNFNKYLIGKDGKLIKHFGSSIKPLSNKITDLII